MADGALASTALTTAAEADGPDPIDVAIGARVRLMRREKGLTQEALGASVGVTFQQVQKYERGANRISGSMIARIAERLKTPIAWFFGEGDDAPAVDSQLAALVAGGDGQRLITLAGQLSPRDLKLLARMAQTLSDAAAESEAGQ